MNVTAISVKTNPSIEALTKVVKAIKWARIHATFLSVQEEQGEVMCLGGLLATLIERDIMPGAYIDSFHRMFQSKILLQHAVKAGAEANMWKFSRDKQIYIIWFQAITSHQRFWLPFLDKVEFLSLYDNTDEHGKALLSYVFYYLYHSKK